MKALSIRQTMISSIEILLSRKQGKEGLTLVEMSIACFILAMLLAGFLTGFTFSRKASRAASDYMQAIHLSRKAIESVVDTSWSSLTNGTYTISNLGMSNYVVIAADPTYASVKNVTVSVRWQNPARANWMSMSYSTSICSNIHTSGTLGFGGSGTWAQYTGPTNW